MAVLIEGKTKIIHDIGCGEVMIESKNDITAGDGEKRDLLEGKAAASTRTTCNVFELLQRAGIRTHFIRRTSETCFTARNVKMIPLELVVRRFATGSYLKRNPDIADGMAFYPLAFEVFEKDDEAHDPLLEFDFKKGMLCRYEAKKPQHEALINEEQLIDSYLWFVNGEVLAELELLALEVFEILEAEWAKQGGVLIDFKIECGFDQETGELLVADVIDNDSWRLRFGDTEMSKENYRQGARTIPELKKDYAEVAAATDRFV